MRKAPGARLQYAITQNEEVDDAVGHGAPEAQRRHVMKVLEEGARQQQHAANHHPRTGVDGPLGEGTNHQVTAKNNVENTRHQQLDHLRRVDDATTVTPAEALVGDGHVAVAHPHQLTGLSIGHVETINQDFARVAADVGHSNHSRDGPVAAV